MYNTLYKNVPFNSVWKFRFSHLKTIPPLFFFWFAVTIISLLLFHLLFFLTHFRGLLFQCSYLLLLLLISCVSFSLLPICAFAHFDLYASWQVHFALPSNASNSNRYCIVVHIHHIPEFNLNSVYSVCTVCTNMHQCVLLFLLKNKGNISNFSFPFRSCYFLNFFSAC